MSFVVAPLDAAWNYLSKLEEWPRTWAGHLKRVTCYPPGAVTEKTQGTLQMKEGFKSRMTMVEFRPGRNWKWIRERAAIPPWLSITSSKL